MTLPEINRRISVGELPDSLVNFAIGCAECHTLNPETHKDNFEHNNYQVHTVVSPVDCAVCHPVEWEEYQGNIMSMAYDNLKENPLYKTLVTSINGMQHFNQGTVTYDPPHAVTDAQSCYYCHGTEIEVAGLEIRDTDLGEMDFPVLTGWPNVGVGRVNPDGSRGSCSSCHARHEFSIEVARKPYTCSECHKGPDVPAFQVYSVSNGWTAILTLWSMWSRKLTP